MDTNSTNYIYKFNTYNDFCDFCNSYASTFKKQNQAIANKIVLYLYNDFYYLTFFDINLAYKNINSLLALLTEFSTPLSNSNEFILKLQEYGIIAFKHNVLNLGVKYFS